MQLPQLLTKMLLEERVVFLSSLKLKERPEKIDKSHLPKTLLKL